MLWFFFPITHCFISRWRGLKLTPSALIFFAHSALARLPKNSVFCTRAGEMLLAQHRPELALAAIDKALVADPTDLRAQRLQNQSSGRDAR